MSAIILVPFTAAEAERVWELPSKRFPELVPLFALGHDVHVIVISLERLIVLVHFLVGLARVRPSSGSLAGATLALVLAPLLCRY